MADWLIPFLLIAVLVSLIRYRKILARKDEQAYHFFTAGIGFFSLALVLRIYQQAGLLAPLPFVSDPVFYRLLFWSAITCGLALLASSLAAYIPIVYRSYITQIDRLRGLELIRSVVRLAAIEPRTDAFIDTSLDHIILSLGESTGAALYRAVGPTFALVSRKGDSPSLEVPEQFSQEERHDFFAAEDNARWFSIPLKWKGRVFAMLVLYRETLLTPDERTNLTAISEIFTRRMILDAQQEQMARTEQLLRIREEVIAFSKQSSNFARSLGVMMTKLRSLYDLDQVTALVLSTNSDKMTSLTVGPTGGVLTEKGKQIPSGLTDVLNSSTTESETLVAAKLISPATVGMTDDVRSILPVGIQFSDSRSLCLLLASRHAEKFAFDCARETLIISGLLRDIAATSMGQHTSHHQKLHIGELESLLHDFLTNPKIDRAGQQQAAFVARLLNAEVVRIMTLDCSPSFLRTLGFVSAHSLGESAASEERILVNRVPYHQEVMTTGRATWFDEQNGTSQIGPDELAAVWAKGCRPITVIPIHGMHGVVGTISVAHGSGATILPVSPHTRQIVHLVAQVMGLVLSYEELAQAGESWSLTRTSDRQLRSRLKSSLSGILGSLELIRMGEGSAGDIDHYLTIIDTSARRINDYLTTGVSAVRDTGVGEQDAVAR